MHFPAVARPPVFTPSVFARTQNTEREEERKMEPPQNDETSEPEVGTYQKMMFGLDTAADPDTAYLCLFVCSALFLWYLRWKGFGRRDERWRQLVSALGRSCQLVLCWFPPSCLLLRRWILLLRIPALVVAPISREGIASGTWCAGLALSYLSTIL